MIGKIYAVHIARQSPSLSLVRLLPMSATCPTLLRGPPVQPVSLVGAAPAVSAAARSGCCNAGSWVQQQLRQRRQRQRWRQLAPRAAQAEGDEGSALASEFQSFVNQQGVPDLRRDRQPTHLMAPTAVVAAQMNALQVAWL